jgi:hypothetical protein
MMFWCVKDPEVWDLNQDVSRGSRRFGAGNRPLRIP